MKIEGFTKFLNSILILISTLLICQNLSGFEKYMSLSSGAGWKSDVDPVFAFRSAEDIFKRSGSTSSATLNFSLESGLQGENSNGFMFDISINSITALQSLQNSIFDAGIEAGYILPVDKFNFMAFILGIHDSTYDYKRLKSLYFNPSFAFSYLHDSGTFYTIFFRTGTTYYKSTSSLIEYINGFSSFIEGGTRFTVDKINTTDIFAGTSFTFFDDQKIKYNRYEDVYYGELDIAGQYYSVYTGFSTEWTASIVTFPLMLKYIYSRSFDEDEHKIVYWSDMNTGQGIYRKTRSDNTIEFSVGMSVDLGDGFSVRADYQVHKNFSNVGKDFGDYADYSRLAHTFFTGASYEY